jgi:diaminopimelate decarboxylase
LSFFPRRDGVLHAEAVSLEALATQYGTPLYVYSASALENAFSAYQRALAGLPHLICYAVKANGNLAILQTLASLGAGFDIVSGGELRRVLAAGGTPDKIIFSGVGKTRDEIRFALETGIHCLNVESPAELARIADIAMQLGRRAPISLRVNPDVDAKTHPYISTGLRDNKFGIPITDALPLYLNAAQNPHLDIVGIDCHIGSQLTDLAPIAEALDRILELADTLIQAGIPLRHIDAGGGLGICYQDETPPAHAVYGDMLKTRFAGRSEHLIIEPGRSLVGNAGVLLTRVEYCKPGTEKNFLIVDAAMNDLIRPALYDAWHDIQPVHGGLAEAIPWEVVGPVCESGDFLGHERPLAVTEDSLLAVFSAGAYGMSMASNYNARGRAAEVLVNGQNAHLARDREDFAALIAGEHLQAARPPN